MSTLMPAGEVIGSQRGDGSKVGWYIGEDDGLPRRLPVHSGARDRYVGTFGTSRQQRMIFIPEAGVYDLSGTVVPVPGATNTVRSVPLEDKYTQLKKLAETIPALRAARVKLLAGTRSARPQVYACACGLEFTNEEIFSVHQEGCPSSGVSAATGAVPSPAVPPPASARDDAPPAPVVQPKPRKPVTCKTPGCGEQFATLPEHNRHKKAAHGRVRT